MIRATTILLLASVLGLCLTGCSIIRKVDGIVLAPLDDPVLHDPSDSYHLTG